MKLSNWLFIFLACALMGVLGAYVYVSVSKPQLMPPQLRIATLRKPTTILMLGTDVVYSDSGRRLKADKDAFTGRSDTIMVGRLDPLANTLRVISIPRDTLVDIPGNGTQKINAANAIGGPDLAKATISNFLDTPIEHYVVLNVHGLVDLVNELGGITVEVPKRMQYMDWTAKLKIDLEPGVHTLTGNQAMGFVRFRHDALGDIGRVQRQEIFLRAVLDKALKPESWKHIPKLIEIAQNYISTDLSAQEILEMANFVRGVPKSNQLLTMMPGNFSPGGDWAVERSDVRRMVARLMGANFIETTRDSIRVSIGNCSSTEGMGFKLAKILGSKGYKNVIVQKRMLELSDSLKRTRIVAQKANPEDASLVKSDLGNIGDVVNASVGDIESSVTIMIGDDLVEKILTIEADSSTREGGSKSASGASP
ncbi:MAG: LCP family protein [Candidatus Obscuribacter phosphatis]|uniref:LCP family protein n=1 Tax=Candidatus Obscuribacter phosphatis TaxID=1906157 RepID=A0A8J7TKP0_9BACT|nr:LCP family protein [Candidatus Obscuribacter phosphatis]